MRQHAMLPQELRHAFFFMLLPALAGLAACRQANPVDDIDAPAPAAITAVEQSGLSNNVNDLIDAFLNTDEQLVIHKDLENSRVLKVTGAKKDALTYLTLRPDIAEGIVHAGVPAIEALRGHLTDKRRVQFFLAPGDGVSGVGLYSTTARQIVWCLIDSIVHANTPSKTGDFTRDYLEVLTIHDEEALSALDARIANWLGRCINESAQSIDCAASQGPTPPDGLRFLVLLGRP